ncbi:MAG TPA: hypothetical protein VGJ20_25040 [Xanthobacteraceae bacterium]|jgi:hypothetical protein
MRSAGNFHPQWGYLAPAPTFLRTARIVVVATAVGATAGAAVVLSLLDRSEVDAAHTSVAAHALVTSAEDAPSTPPVASVANASATAPSSQVQSLNGATPTRTEAQLPVLAAAVKVAPPSDPHAATDVASTSTTAPTPQALATAPAAIDPASLKNDNTPTAAPEAKKLSRKRFGRAHYAQRGEPPGRYGRAPGLMPLWPRLFTSQSGPSYPSYRGL